MKKIIGLIVLCAAVFAGFNWYTNRRTEAFVAEMKKEYQGYRLEHFMNEKLLFLHAPDGSKDLLKNNCIIHSSLVEMKSHNFSFKIRHLILNKSLVLR
jgi:hypothetical protein